MKGETTKNQESTNTSAWDSLAQGPKENPETTEVKKVTKAEWLEAHRDEIQESATGHAAEAGDTNKAFKKYVDRLRKEGRDLSQKEFETWEADYAFSLKMMNDEYQRGEWSPHLQDGIEKMAEISAPIIAECEGNQADTIEAMAGDYFQTRSTELRAAIDASESSSKDADLKRLASFYQLVARHVEYRWMTPDEVREECYDEYSSKRFDEDRTAAHNSAIECLNDLNDLARKYDTKPFMARNLWTSRNKNQTRQMSRRMSCDRHLFERYYERAFSELEARAKARYDRYSF